MSSLIEHNLLLKKGTTSRSKSQTGASGWEGRRRDYPADNYLTGDGKSEAFSRSGAYGPRQRKWIDYRNVHGVARDKIAYLKEFDNEDSWRDWQFGRDVPGSEKCASTGWTNSTHPSRLRLDGYAWNPHNLYRTGAGRIGADEMHRPWPSDPASASRSFPLWRGPRGHYGYYHEELDIHRDGGYRVPRDPRTLVNQEDISKMEFLCGGGGGLQLHGKSPATFPALT